MISFSKGRPNALRNLGALSDVWYLSNITAVEPLCLCALVLNLDANNSFCYPHVIVHLMSTCFDNVKCDKAVIILLMSSHVAFDSLCFLFSGMGEFERREASPFLIYIDIPPCSFSSIFSISSKASAYYFAFIAFSFLFCGMKILGTFVKKLSKSCSGRILIIR